jgi:acyl transferase domain-containing protein
MSETIAADDLPESIAIIGMSGRFPGARNLDEFWRNLRDGVESVSFFSDEELRQAGLDPAVRRDPNYVGAGGVLPDIDLFDAALFGFNPREAEAMDPQHRLFLECAWESLENAGYDPARYRGSIGVYAGTGFSTYFFNLYQNQELMSLLGGHQVMIGNDKDHLTTHVSYKLNLRGPSMAVQTACSTSLVAVCVACRSLLDFQCDMALAGGSSIAVPQGRGYFYREGGIASPDGHCRAFDAAAQGTVAGNGIGIVLLKRYAEALADGDPIRAVIRGCAVNNDGAVKVGYTAPSVQGQAEVIAMARAVAGVDAESITLIEAHGTGTALGDPIEIAALAQVFGDVKARRHCAVGSVKSNIGHLDTAAGVAGLIKTVLALEHRTIPPSLHFREPNARLQLDRTPFYVPTRAAPWKVAGTPRRAGVSSFGIGGTNAHAVMEEAPARGVSGSARSSQLLLLSANTATALDASAANYASYFTAGPDAGLADVAFTAAVGRKSMRHRLAFVCRDACQAAALLGERPAGQIFRGTPEPKHCPVAFLFPGQGSQYAGMAAGLYCEEPVFREHLDACLELLERQSGVALRPMLCSQAVRASAADAALSHTAAAQPALFAIEYALARLWMAWGVRPESMIGHSIGEWVAACLAGVFSLEDALRLVALRGRLMQALPEGAMMAAPIAERAAAELLSDGLSLAAVNAPSQCVLSGPFEAIERAASELQRRGVEGVRLKTSHAFHSAMMEPMLPAFAEAVAEVERHAPSIPVASNVTGGWLTAEDAIDPQYWARQIRSTVRFADGLGRILQEPASVLIEVGPGQTLAGLARQHPAKALETVVLGSVRPAADPHDDYAYLLESLGCLWTSGGEPDWAGFYAGERRLRVPLPTYPFERKRFWIDPPRSAPAPPPEPKRSDIAGWFYIPSWTRADLLDASPTAPREWVVVGGGPMAERLRAAGHTVTGSLGGRRDAVCYCGDDVAGLLDLARALAGSHTTINVVSAGVHAVLSSDAVEPERAALLGACAVIPQEQPGLRCRHIDVPESEWSTVFDSVLRDLASPVKDTVIAYRGGRRWVRCYEPAVWPEAKTGGLLRQHGVYLITGGFGNVGVTLAESLARRQKARLALLSRRTELTARDRDAVRELEALGARVLVLTADVRLREQMEAAITRTLAEYGELHGVIHAAGALDAADFRPIGQTGGALIERHFGPKVAGARILAELLDGRPLDFCMLVSSLSSVLGGLNFAAYAAANSALDAFAERQNQRAHGARWLSVNWDGWRFDPGSLAEFFLTPAEGAEAFRRILAYPGAARVVVSTGDLEERLARWVRFERTEETPEPVTSAHARPDLETAYEQPGSVLEQMVADVWQTILGMNSVGIHDNFFELGGHSLLAIQLVGRLRDLFQADIGITALFEYPTVAQLAGHIEGMTENAGEPMEELARMLDYVEQLSPEEVKALLAEQQGS